MKKMINRVYIIIVFLCLYKTAIAQHTGGNGKGDATASSAAASLYNRWYNTENNRVLTRAAFNSAIDIGVFSANPLTNDLNSISANTISASSYSLTTAGIDASSRIKSSTSSNQLLIRGDFRSIRIDPTIGQTQCVTRPTYSILLWLDDDQIFINQTRCFTDKTLIPSSAYSPPSTTAWFNIENGKAIQIDSNGVITAICN